MHTNYRPLFEPWNIKERKQQEKREMRHLYSACAVVILIFMVVVL